MMFKYVTCLVLFITWYQLADCHPAGTDVKSLDAMVDKETDAYLSVEANESGRKAVRDKRTIGFLRQMFPNLSQIVDRKIQQITRFVFRVIGRLVLRGGGTAGGAANGGGGGGGSEAGTGGGRRISITLPTFPPSADDSEEEQTDVPAATPVAGLETRLGSDAVTTPAAASDSAPAASADSSEATAVVAASDSAPADSVPAASSDSSTSAPDVSVTSTDVTPTTTTDTAVSSTSVAISTNTDATATIAAAAAATTTTTTSANITNGPTTQTQPSDSDNTVGTVKRKRTARDVSTEESSSARKHAPITDTDDNDVSSNAGDDAAAAAATTAEDDPRNKRFSFNLRGSGGGGDGGGGGGSGNFIFDLIRRGADRAARAAGGFYRVVAGTDPNTLTLAQPLQYPSLIAGSGANQDRDESPDAGPLVDSDAAAQGVHAEVNAKEDGYSVGVPGPLTRIFVIANRGVANLIQDLILRLAQTTERIVNFKARLITSLI